MRLIDVVSAPWAITPEMFGEVQGIYARHCRGEKIDLKAVEARVGAPLNNVRRDYELIDGVAVIPAEGVLAKRMNLFMQISGGTSMQILAAQIRAAADDPNARAIILSVDSPGGTVDGTLEAASAVREAGAKKPVLTLAGGVMASAAYWIGSAAGPGRVFVSDDTTGVGSIGVVATHMDVSAAEAQRGVKTTEITAGKYKRIASQYAPLSPEGRATIQEQVDYLYSLFVDSIADARGVSTETVLSNMADGRMFIGRQAVEAGLVDGVSTLSELIARINAGEFNAASTPKAEDSAGVAHAVDSQSQEVQTMDVAKLKAEHPEIANALIEEGRTAGADAERARIKDVEAQVLPGHEALIASLKFDGKTTGPEAAVAVLNAERGKRGDKLAALRKDADAAAAPGASQANPAAGAEPPADAPLEERAKAKWEKDASLRAEFGGSYEKYFAFAKADDLGRARIMARK